MSGQHIPVEKPKSTTMQAFLGKPVIIEPLELADKKPEWKTAPWSVILWADDGEGFQGNEMLVFAKAIISSLEIAKKSGGWIGGILQKEGSQFWVDSSNALIMRSLQAEWDQISGGAANTQTTEPTQYPVPGSNIDPSTVR
jgi:hypothetical protein